MELSYFLYSPNLFLQKMDVFLFDLNHSIVLKDQPLIFLSNPNKQYLFLVLLELQNVFSNLLFFNKFFKEYHYRMEDIQLPFQIKLHLHSTNLLNHCILFKKIFQELYNQVFLLLNMLIIFYYFIHLMVIYKVLPFHNVFPYVYIIQNLIILDALNHL